MNKVSLQPLISKTYNGFYRHLTQIILTLSLIVPFQYTQGQMSIALETTVPACGDFTDGKVNATINGGVAPFTLLWNTGHDGLSLIGVGYGDYSLTVTDANGLSAMASTTLTGPAAIEPVFTFTDDVCDGPPTNVRVEGSGGIPPYTYLWDNGSTDVDRQALDFGTYCVTIEDAVGCRGAGCVIVPLTFDIRVSAIAPLCPAGCDGAAVVEVFGGQKPYDILWSNGVTTSLNPMLLPGSYGVTVTDANGCLLEGVAKVPDGTGTLEIVTVESVDPTCGIGGSINVEAIGTNEPLSYLWNNGATTPTLEDLSAGTYKVTVADANNCRISEEITIEDNTNLAAEIVTSFVCGDQFGAATANGVGGVPPYQYAWNNGQTGATINNLTPGEIYKVSVTDAAGCTVTKTAVISDFDELIVSISSRNPSCNGVPDAEATAVVSNNTGEVRYFWNGGQQRQSLTALRPGTYSVTVFDENGCAGEASVTIVDPDPLSVEIEVTEVTCGELNSGSAIATVVGGTPPYLYSWTNGSNMPEATGLDVGAHSILVTDAQGCQIFEVIELVEFANVNIELSATDPTCGENNGNAAVTITGGDAPFEVTWSNGEQGTAIDGIGAGNYAVTVTDVNGCQVSGNIVLNEASDLVGTIEKTDLNCQGDTNGTLSIFVSGGTPPYQYQWGNNQTTSALEDLPAGNYSVVVEDAAGCRLIAEATIEEPSILVIDIEKKNIICGNNTGAAKATAFGGAGSFTYLWSNGETGSEITDLSPGTYTIKVQDANGCEKEGSVEITEVGDEVNASIQIDQQPMGDQNIGQLTANGAGGVAPYSFEWSTRAFTQTIDELSPGIYSVTVIDASGCFGVAEVELNSLSNLECEVVVTATLSEDTANDGALQANVMGGLPPYTYLWEDGSATESIEDLAPGTYAITITDANNQTTACSVVLQEFVPICINLTNPGRIGYNQSVCGPGNFPEDLVSLEPASGAEGEIEYLWMKTVEPGPFDPVTWDNIPNSNTVSLNPGPVYETTYFARCARIVGCPYFLETSIITVDVEEVAVAEFVSEHVPICQNIPTSFEALDNGEGATYFWNFGTNATPSTSSDIAVDVTWASNGIKRVSLTVEKDGCTSTNFLWVTITDSPIYCSDGLEIDVEEEEEEVIIIWETGKEEPGSGNIDDQSSNDPLFEVERASANHDFFPLDNVIEPYDSTADFYRYRFVDRVPLEGISYYRVRFVDRWKNEFQSNEVDVQRFDEELGEVFAYPNPFFQIFTIERVDFHTEKPISLQIQSATGQKVFVTGLDENELRKKIDMDLYSSGVYFVKVMIEDEEALTFRLIKVNH